MRTIATAAHLTALGERAKALPFTATVDAAGRIAVFTLTVPVAGDAKKIAYQVAYRRYGSAEAVAEPAGARPAPAAAYELLNG